MRVALSALCVGFGCVAGALAGEGVPMVTIAQFLAKSGERVDSPHTVQFVAMRCAALYLTLASAIPSSEDRKGLKQGLSQKAGWFLVTAQGVQQKVAPENAGVDFVMGNVKTMQELYIGRAVDARARTGHFSDDPIIRSDVEYCRVLVSPS